MNTIRAFIALELPETILAAMAKIQQGVKAHGLKIRMTPPQNIHLTLKFLGDMEPRQVDGVTAILSKAVSEQGPFLLKAKGAGVFPSLMRPNVFWIGMGGQLEALTRFQQGLDRSLSEIGFDMEKRPFKSHLTIGRFKGRTDNDRLVQAVRSVIDFESPSFEANRITLFKSDLQPNGAVYTRLCAFGLK